MIESSVTPAAPAIRRPPPAAGFANEDASGARWLARSGLAVIGALLFAQSAFVVYLLASYGRSTLRGDVAAWSRFSATGWVPGDTAGNGAMAVHLLVAVVVLVAGALQVAPLVRRRAPLVHRWSGRLYMLGCLLGAVSGLLMVWGRGTVGDLSQHVAISINAVLLATCAVMAWRAARARDFGAHKQWAMRTFVVASGVLYFRLFLALWLLTFRAPVGFDPRTFSGPFLTALAFTVYVFGPLLLYEMYRAGERTKRRSLRRATAALMFTTAGAVIMGTLSAVAVLWGPKVGAS